MIELIDYNSHCHLSFSLHHYFNVHLSVQAYAVQIPYIFHSHHPITIIFILHMSEPWWPSIPRNMWRRIFIPSSNSSLVVPLIPCLNSYIHFLSLRSTTYIHIILSVFSNHCLFLNIDKNAMLDSRLVLFPSLLPSSLPPSVLTSNAL